MLSQSNSGSPGAFVNELNERNLREARTVAILAAVLVPASSLLDVLINPHHAGLFFKVRVGCSIVCLLWLPLTYRAWSIRQTFALGLFPLIFASVALQILVEILGGYTSTYYAGHVQVIMGLGVMFHWTLRRVLSGAIILLLVWVVPALYDFPFAEPDVFVNNLYALLVAVALAVASNATRFAALRREFQAKEALSEKSNELAVSLGKLQELDRTKTRFFANISHELRTPLTLILAPVQNLIAHAESEGLREKLGAIRRNAERLLRLIDELLDLSKLDAGGLRLNVDRVDVMALAEAVYQAARPAAESRNIEFTLEGESAPRDMYGDAHRLEIVLTNLVGNALKYTPNGRSITLRVETVEDGVRLHVEDTGPGISEADLPHVFDRFFQVGQERRRTGGVGIGLALAKELAELHGGALTASSVLGEGTTFTLSLPRGYEHFTDDVVERRKLAKRASMRSIKPVLTEVVAPSRAPSAMPASSAPPDRSGSRVVVVDDHDELRDFIQSLLETEFVVLTARDGVEALKIVRQEKPQLVVSDVMMPNMNGTELCAKIKSDPELRQIPVILLTAKTGSDSTIDAYHHGADDFVAKPFHPEVLLARVRAQLNIRTLGRKLVMQEKLYTVGSLAAGVAHEVRNPVNAILNASLAITEAELDADTQKKLMKVILDGTRRIQGIIGALDAHARPSEQMDQPGWADPQEGIESTFALLAHKMKDVQTHIKARTSKRVAMPTGPLNQVFLNIIDNAVRSGAKNIWVTIDNAVRESTEMVAIRIENDGDPIPPKIIHRIFDPFFTTRAAGEGTGLGLHLSRSLIQENGGDLSVQEGQSGGPRFEISLPVRVSAITRSA